MRAKRLNEIQGVEIDAGAIRATIHWLASARIHAARRSTTAVD
jgi:hypothetical protein